MKNGFDVNVVFSDEIIEQIKSEESISRVNLLVIPEDYEDDFPDMELDLLDEALSSSYFIKEVNHEIVIDTFENQFKSEIPKELVSLKKIQDEYYQNALLFINKNIKNIPPICQDFSRIVIPFVEDKVFLELIEQDEYFGESFLGQQDKYYYIYTRKEQTFMDFMCFYTDDAIYHYEGHICAIKPLRLQLDTDSKFSKIRTMLE